MWTNYASRYRWAILGLALLAQVSSSMVGQSLPPLAPLFQPELGLSKAEVGMFNSAVFIGAWTMTLMAGSLVDRFGIRRMISLSQVATGLMLMAMATSTSVLQAAAVMFAAGAIRGPMFPGSTKAILDWFSPAARGTVMGLKQAGMPTAGVITASVLPVLGLTIGWRSALSVVGLFIVASGIVTAVLYRDPGHQGQVPTRAVSIRDSLREVVRNRRVWIASLTPLLLLIVQQSLTAYLALYFKEVVLIDHVPDDRARIVAAGGFLALCQMGAIFGRVFWGVVSDRVFHGRRAVVLAIVGTLSMLMSVAMSLLRPDHPTWLLAAVVMVYGATAVGWNGIFVTMIAETTERKHAATAVGLSLTISEAGSVGGPPLFGFIVDVTGTYRVAWLLLACIAAAGTLVSIVLAKEEKRAA